LYKLYGENPFNVIDIPSDLRDDKKLKFAGYRDIVMHYEKVPSKYAGVKIWQWVINPKGMNMYCKMFNLKG